MHLHIFSARRRLNKTGSVALVALLALLVVSGSEAIVTKPQQQRSDDSSSNIVNISSSSSSSSPIFSSSSSSSSPSSSSSSSASSPSSSSSPSVSSSASPSNQQPQLQQQQQQQQQQQPSQQYQNAYNINHQQQPQQMQSSQPTYSSSISMTSSSSSGSSPSSASQSAPSMLPSSSQQMINSQNQALSNVAYSGYGTYSNPKSSAASSSYMVDNMQAAASNSDPSYQAAANSVNMALASSGLFGTGPGSQSAGSMPSSSSQQQQAQQQQQQNQAGLAQSLNPVHYFYYPAKEAGASSAAIAGNGQQQQQQAAASTQPKSSSANSQNNLDLLSNAASNSYQSMAYPSYDSLSGALGAGLEASASGQDSSYLPQPSAGGQQQQQQQQQQQSASNGPQNDQSVYLAAAAAAAAASGSQSQQMPANQMMHQPSQYNPADLGSLQQASQPQPQQQQPSQQPGSQQQHNGAMSYSGATNQNGDFQQGAGPLQSASSNLYNQIGDLLTPNFGSNGGGVPPSVAYLPPNQQQQHQQQQQQQQQQQHHQQQHPQAAIGAMPDLFSSGSSSFGSQFNSNPASQQVGGPQTVSASSGPIYGASSSLFSGSNPSAGNSLFANQHFMNTLLSPSQYLNPLAGSDGAVQMQNSPNLQTAASSTQSAVAPASGSSSKRFGLGSFIMPMLALAGLSLLIPTMSNIGTAVGRKKRSIVESRAADANRQQQIVFDAFNGAGQFAKESSIGEYMDKIERYYSIYKDAVENDECMNRLICEFGDAVKDVAGKSAVVTVIEKLVPTWMVGKVHLFKEAAMENKAGREKCKKYVCNSSKYH